MKSNRLIILAAALACVTLLLSCATNPVTGEREFVLMTEGQEIAMGQEYHPEIIATYGLYPDQGLQDYVNEIGQEMAARSHRPHLEWHFTVLDSPVVNAFAVPGGYIYITRGLMAHLNSEAELAGVLGHEIGHVTARHSVRAYTRQLLVIGAIAIGAAANSTFRKVAPFALIGAQVLFLKYSRDQERQADDLGVLYTYRTGYNPAEFGNFFLTLNRMKEESGGGGLPGWLSTHPVTELRYQDVGDEAQRVMAEQPPQGQLMVRNEEYVQRIDGMVFGENPRQGYIENGVFYHPDLAFRFSYPSSWNLQNTNAAVVIAPEAGDALIQLTISGAASPQQALDNMIEQYELSTVRTTTSPINGMPAAHAICQKTDDEDETLIVRASAIAKGGSVYTFMGAADSGKFDGYLDTFNNTINSFNNLSDPSALGRQPMHVAVRKVRGNQPAQRYLETNGVTPVMVNEALLINGLHPTDTIRGNSLVKLIR